MRRRPRSNLMIMPRQYSSGGSTTAVEPMTQVTTYQPTNNGGVENGVKVPVFQTFVTAIIVVLFYWCGLYVLSYYVSINIPVFASGLFVFSGTLLVAWIKTTQAYTDILHIAETITNFDLNKDGDVGEPKPQPPVKLIIDQRTNQSYQRKEGVMPCSRELFDRWVLAAANGQELTYDRWVYGGGPFTQDEYRKLIRVMKDAGVVAKTGRGITSGIELTEDGKTVLENYITNNHSPTDSLLL